MFSFSKHSPAYTVYSATGYNFPSYLSLLEMENNLEIQESGIKLIISIILLGGRKPVTVKISRLLCVCLSMKGKSNS